MVEDIERKIIEIIATDRIYIPISSLDGKLDRKRKKLAKAVELEGNKYVGDRVYARVKEEDKMKARGMRDGIEKFAQEYPRYGKILNGMIEEERANRERHLYFGVNSGCRLTADDYRDVLTDLGFTKTRTKTLYQELMQVSRSISKKRDEERSVLIGKEDNKED
jgi:hypothetical protein